MVKRQKEKQYESTREHRSNRPSASSSSGGGGNNNSVRPLPFDCCALSLLPFSNPVCTRHNGIVFDRASIETFLKENQNTDPVTGYPLSPGDLVQLQMDRDDEGRWQCPVLAKPFANHTKIVAIVQPPDATTTDTTATSVVANVYSYEAYQELNVKANNYRDLITGSKFHKRNDVLMLNDPEDPQWQHRRDINSFYHIRNQRQLLEQAEKNGNSKGTNPNIRLTVTATRIMDKFQKQKQEQATTENNNKRALLSSMEDNVTEGGKRIKIYANDVTGVALTAGKASGSLTSTTMAVTHLNEAREATSEEILTALCQALRKLSKKAYVKLETNLGTLLLEIHCDMVPRTAINFIKLCQAKKYNGSKFHRLIPNFMIQGGKPAKDKNNNKNNDDEDVSFWGGSFKDEFHDKLKHDAPGIVSMANAGANTNKRQFFITFQPCEYLNKKHSIFGLVVQGMDVLKKMEKISTDKKERPTEAIIIQDTIVIDNPVEEAEALEQKRIAARAKARSEMSVSHSDKAKTTTLTTQQLQQTGQGKPQIGRYLPKTAAAAAAANANASTLDAADSAMPSAKPAAKPQVSKPTPKMKFGNFSGW